MCNREFSTTPEVDVHFNMFHKDNGISTSPTPVNCSNSGTVEYQQSFTESTVNPNPPVTVPAINSMQTLPPVSRMSQPVSDGHSPVSKN